MNLISPVDIIQHVQLGCNVSVTLDEIWVTFKSYGKIYTSFIIYCRLVNGMFSTNLKLIGTRKLCSSEVIYSSTLAHSQIFLPATVKKNGDGKGKGKGKGGKGMGGKGFFSVLTEHPLVIGNHFCTFPFTRAVDDLNTLSGNLLFNAYYIQCIHLQ